MESAVKENNIQSVINKWKPLISSALEEEKRNVTILPVLSSKKLKHRLVLAKADDYLEITQIIHEMKLT